MSQGDSQVRPARGGMSRRAKAELDLQCSQPQLLDADPRESRCVLLVHGFSGSPFELHLLAAFLHQRGYHCSLPLLSGHHGSMAELSHSRWSHWLLSAERALAALWARTAARSGKTPKLAVLGLSMGGLLTAELGYRYPLLSSPEEAGTQRPQVSALGIFASPLWLTPFQEKGISLLARTPGIRRLFVPKLAGSDLRSDDFSFHRLRPKGMPLMALRSLLELQQYVRPHLPSVMQPTLLAHGQQDHTAPYACMSAYEAELGTPREQLSCLTLPDSYHLIPLDVERQQLFAATATHLEKYLGSPEFPGR